MFDAPRAHQLRKYHGFHMNKKQLIRFRFRQVVFTRDEFQCRICGLKPVDEEDLDAHHITSRDDMPNGGYVKENGITLCKVCHAKAEIALQWWNRVDHLNPEWSCPSGCNELLPNALYSLIGSNRLIAEQESAKL